MADVRSAIGSPTPSSGPPCGRSSMSAPIERRMSMTARRVGFTPTSRMVELGIGVDGAGDQPERGRRDVARDPFIDRLHCHSLLAPSGHPASAAPSRSTGHARARASVPCGRASRPSRGPSFDHPPAAPRAGSPTSPARSAPASRMSIDRSGLWPTTVRGGRESFRGLEHGAHRAQWFDDTSHRTAAQRGVAVEDGGQGQPREHAREQPQARAGVAAVEDRRRARAGRPRPAR